jgi:hypothetical protein
MLEALAGKPIQNDFVRLVNQAIPGTLALCEPWFGHASLALSPDKLHFKVHVINDPAQGLVKLFEMVRIDKHVLCEMLLHDEIRARFPMFSGRSAFLKSDRDAAAGVAAFHSCVENLGIDGKVAVATETAFIEAIVAIHKKLEFVLVEDLPVPDFFTRFDKPYTVFFVPAIHGSVDKALAAINPALAGLQASLLIEASSENDMQDALKNYANGVPVKASGSIVVHTSEGRARKLVVFKRAI